MDWKWAFAPAAIAVVAVVVVAAVVVIVSGPPIFDREASPAPTGTASGSYHPANETLRVTLTNVEYTDGGDAATVWIAHDGGEPVSLRRGDTTAENGVWYAPDRPRILDRAVRSGDAVTVVGDGTDADGDGTAGVECGEVYRLIITPPDDNPRTIEKFAIGEVGGGCDARGRFG